MLRQKDKELYEAIRSGGAARHKAIAEIYGLNDLKMKVVNYVARRGGSKDDGLDIYHEGIIALDRNIRNDKFRSETSLEGYLYSICRFAWNNEWRKRSKQVTRDIQEYELPPDEETPEEKVFSSEQKSLLTSALDLLDKPCIEILKMWKLSYSMEEIAKAQDLSSPAMAKKYRYRCMQKLMKRLNEHPELLKALQDV